MKKLLALIMVCVLCSSILLGCSDNKKEAAENIHTEFEGVFLTLGSVSEDSLTVEWHNDTRNEITFGEYYYVEKYNEASGKWKSVLIGEFPVIEIVTLLSPGGVCEKVYSLDFFDVSEDCKYRLRVDFYPGVGDERYNTWVEFYTTVKFVQYDWSGWGLSTKNVSDCEAAYDIIEELRSLKQTGKTVPQISSKSLYDGISEDVVERGTLWLEVGSKIYRIESDTKELCLVDGHLGKGYVLDASSEFISLIYKVRQYHPYDFYVGNYSVAADELELDNVYEADSTVDIKVKKIEIGEGDQFEPVNKITLELLSETEQTLSIALETQQSSDNFASMESLEVTLEEGKAETVEISFGGWQNYDYYVTVTADNTRISITIDQ